MRRFVWILMGTALLVAIACCVIAERDSSQQAGPAQKRASSPESVEISVMTWNVGYLSLTPPVTARDKDIEAIVSVLKEHSPDLISLQELSSEHQAVKIAAALGEEYRVATVSHAGPSAMAVLTRFPILESEVRKSVTWRKELVEIAERLHGEEFGESATWRKGLAVTVGHPQRPGTVDYGQPTARGGLRITIIAVHAPPPLLMGTQDMKKYVEDMADWGVEFQADAVVIAGDLNLDASSRDKEHQEIYDAFCERYLDCAKDAGPTGILSQRIDYIWARPKETEVVEAQVLVPSRRYAGVGLSDHRPVLVRLRIRMGGR